MLTLHLAHAILHKDVNVAFTSIYFTHQMVNLQVKSVDFSMPEQAHIEQRQSIRLVSQRYTNWKVIILLW